MATTLLRRQLAGASKRLTASTSSSSWSARRPLSGSAALLQAEHAPRTSGRDVFDTHVVEDLHGVPATEILVETGTRRDAQMRHFTGE